MDVVAFISRLTRFAGTTSVLSALRFCWERAGSGAGMMPFAWRISLFKGNEKQDIEWTAEARDSYPENDI